MPQHWRDQWQRPDRERTPDDSAALHALGLGKKAHAAASPEEIKDRFRVLANRWHPDRHTGGAEKAAAEAQYATGSSIRTTCHACLCLHCPGTERIEFPLPRFKKISEAFRSLQGSVVASSEVVAIDPFGGVPWYHYSRFPPWSFSRGPPFLPRGVSSGALCAPASPRLQ